MKMYNFIIFINEIIKINLCHLFTHPCLVLQELLHNDGRYMFLSKS